MIKTQNGKTEIKVGKPAELFEDMLHIFTAFVAYSKSIQVPDEIIEKIMVQMIVDAFSDSVVGDLIDLGKGVEDGNAD